MKDMQDTPNIRKRNYYYLLILIPVMAIGIPGNVLAGIIFTDLGLAVKGAPMSAATLAKDTTGTKDLIYSVTQPNFTSGELIGYDPISKEETHIALPDGITGVIGMVTGADGTIYGGAEFPAQLWAYNPMTDISTRNLGVIDSNMVAVWSMAVGADGKIYGGTEDQAELFVYNPQLSTMSTLGELIPNEWIARCMTGLPDGRIAYGTGTSGHLSIYNPTDGTLKILTTQSLSFVYSMCYGSDGYVYAGLNSSVLVMDPSTDSIIRTFDFPTTENPINSFTSDSSGYVYFSTSPTGYLFRYNYSINSIENLGIPVFGDDAFLVCLDNNRIAGVSEDGIVFIYDPATKTYSYDTLQQSLNVSQGVISLQKGPDGNIYGGTRINHHLFQLDAGNKTFTDFGKPITGAGEVHTLCNSSTGKKIYLGSFTGARFSVYDLDTSWSPGFSINSNPKLIGQVAPNQTWIIAMTTLPDGRVLIGSEPDFGGFDGHLIIYNPIDESLTDLGVPFSNQHINSLTVNPYNDMVYGSTTPITNGTYGGDSYIPPYIFTYNYHTHQVLSMFHPYTTEIYINSLTALPDGRIYGGTDPEGYLFYMIPGINSVNTLSKPISLYNVVSDLTKDNRNLIYGVSGDQVFRIDPSTNSVTDLGRPAPGNFLNRLTSDNNNNIYLACIINGHVYMCQEISTQVEPRIWEFFE